MGTYGILCLVCINLFLLVLAQLQVKDWRDFTRAKYFYSYFSIASGMTAFFLRRLDYNLLAYFFFVAAIVSLMIFIFCKGLAAYYECYHKFITRDLTHEKKALLQNWLVANRTFFMIIIAVMIFLLLLPIIAMV